MDTAVRFDLAEAGLAGEWLAVASEAELRPGSPLTVQLAQQTLVLWVGLDGQPQAAFGTAAGQPDARINLVQAYGFIWLCFGPPKRQLFSLPEYAEPDGRIVHCGAFGVRTSPLRAVENFLDMGHFPFVHTDVLGKEPYTEVKSYRVDLREAAEELWATDCYFHQPK